MYFLWEFSMEVVYKIGNRILYGLVVLLLGIYLNDFQVYSRDVYTFSCVKIV